MTVHLKLALMRGHMEAVNVTISQLYHHITLTSPLDYPYIFCNYWHECASNGQSPELWPPAGCPGVFTSHWKRNSSPLKTPLSININEKIELYVTNMSLVSSLIKEGSSLCSPALCLTQQGTEVSYSAYQSCINVLPCGIGGRGGSYILTYVKNLAFKILLSVKT